MNQIRILLLLLVALFAATADVGRMRPQAVIRRMGFACGGRRYALAASSKLRYARFPPYISLCIALLFASGAAYSTEFTAEVIAVLDGDTLLVTRGGKPLKLRMAEIDAPEKAQPYGTASQKSLADLVMRKQVQVESRAVDDYGRMVAMVSIGGLNVNHEQVRRGLAWEYSRFHSNRPLMALQREAQLAKRGLWADEDIVEPSKWRKQHASAPSVASPVIATPVVVPSAAKVAADEIGCGKARCSMMTSCADAKRYYARCGGKPLDGDGDGRPCEKLCAAEGVKLR